MHHLMKTRGYKPPWLYNGYIIYNGYSLYGLFEGEFPMVCYPTRTTVVTADVLHRKWLLPSSQLVYGAGFIRYVAEYKQTTPGTFSRSRRLFVAAFCVSPWKHASSGWHLLVTTTGVRSIKWCPLRWYYPDKNVISSCICDLEIFSQW